MALDRTTVAKIARLARIKVKPEELDGLAGELNGMLTWVEQLQQVNVEGVEPMTGTVVAEDANGAGAALRMREDVVNDGGQRDKVLANAPRSAAGFFAVPKVIE